MLNIITNEMISNFPYEIERIVKENSMYSKSVSRDYYDQYDTKELKEYVTKRFTKFHNIGNLNQFPITSVNYELKENMFTKTTSDKVGTIALNNLDNQLCATDFYYAVLRVAYKLTQEECDYLIGAFFKMETEEVLCEKIGKCRNSLRSIKKSCLLKLMAVLQHLETERVV